MKHSLDLAQNYKYGASSDNQTHYLVEMDLQD